MGRSGAATRAREERELLIGELSRAVDLGGGDRTASSDVEGARLSVTKSIRLAIGRINDYSAPLGEQLSRTIHTGTLCSYNPDPSTHLTWLLSNAMARYPQTDTSA